MDDLYRKKGVLCESIYKYWGDCVRWIAMEVHVDPWLCIVRLGVEQRYGESPGEYNSGTVKARTYLLTRDCE